MKDKKETNFTASETFFLGAIVGVILYAIISSATATSPSEKITYPPHSYLGWQLGCSVGSHLFTGEPAGVLCSDGNTYDKSNN